jgi:MFS transporter, DHA1 family, solute carrier family 18 (vesicular amine transporter), member 1/2
MLSGVRHRVTMSLRSSRALAVALVTASVFTDILAYSIAVPVLPHLSRQFGASPTLIGLLFGSFGVTLLMVSVPMGAISDRIGRRLPLVGGLVALAGSSLMFAFAPRMSWLFAARLAQGAADAVTWVVGFALVADLYTAEERGAVMGLVMSGSTFGFMIGPTLGGWLYETGGIRMPYLVVAALSIVTAAGLACVRVPTRTSAHDAVSLATIVRVPAVTVCAIAVVAGGGTIAMLEPVLSLFLASEIGLGPARIGLVFGGGAVVAAILHPVFGRIADRSGGRRLTLWGLAAVGAVLPLLARVWSFESAVGFYAIAAVTFATMITPSLTYMAEATASAGSPSFGVAYGLYNVAWAIGLLIGPALGGFLFERLGFTELSLVWAPVVVAIAIVLAQLPGTRSNSKSD